MAKITRRTAVATIGAATATAISPTLARVYRTGAVDIDTQLRELADQFQRDAMVIDPTIEGVWLGHDFTVPGRESAVMCVTFERKTSRLVRRAKTQTT